LNTKSALGDPVDGEVVPRVLYMTGLPNPGRPKAEKHSKPDDERERHYNDNKATEQPRIVHLYKSYLQPGRRIPHKAYSGHIFERVVHVNFIFREFSSYSNGIISTGIVYNNDLVRRSLGP